MVASSLAYSFLLLEERTGLTGTAAQVALAFILLLTLCTIAVIWRTVTKALHKTNARGDTVLLLGAVGAGKTCLLHKLAHGTVPETVPSMKECTLVTGLEANTDKHETKNIKIMDFPGHERLRMRLHGIYPIAAGIVFLLDGSDIKNALRPSAEFLFDIFTDPTIVSSCPPMLIAINKADILAVKSLEALKIDLESELTQLKGTRSSLETEGEDGGDNIPLGREGQPFRFDIDSPSEVLFASISVTTGKVEAVQQFINNNC